MEDARIVELYWERDEAAIAESSAKYGGYCYQIAFRILALREDAEECVGDTWLRAWEAMPPSRPGRLDTFLGKITRNLSLDRWRALRAQKRWRTGGTGADGAGDCLPPPAAWNRRWRPPPWRRA
ncbi:MAG: RNA polymerase sigma factor [Dysosmobacter welbionis]